MNQNAFLLKLLIALISYFEPISALLHIVIIFILIDFMTGVYASYKTKRQICSRRLRKTIEKFVFYSVAIMIGYMFQKHFAGWTNLGQIIAGFIAMTELYSIYENITRITGTDILKKLKEVLKLKK